MTSNPGEKKPIIAIVGLPGAGKTVAVQYLMQKTGWPKVYFGDLILDEVKRRNLIINEVNERLVREELRAKHGMGACAILSLSKIQAALKNNPGVFIESMYSWEEYLELKKEFSEAFKVIAIYAPFSLRAERLARRPQRPLQAAEVESRDYSQIANLHQAGPIARADATVLCEGTLEELYRDLDGAFARLQ
ncbi:MAG: AAA family ATPase [bacterium]|nr:AAA family ATPase [bacterium]